MDMNTIKQAAEQYNQEFNQNILELQALENVLKDDFNKYIDSLAKYLDKCKLIEDNYNKALDSYDNKDRYYFVNLIPNNLIIDSYKNGKKYIFDNNISGGLNNSLALVNAMASDRLLERKIL